MKTKYQRRIQIYASLLIVVVLVMGLSYAYYRLSISQTSQNNVSGLTCFNTTLTDKTAALSLTNAYPIPDAEGFTSTPYTFTVTNNCDQYLTLKIGIETLTTSTIASDYIKAAVTDEGVTPTAGLLLTSQPTGEALNGGTTYILYSSKIYPNASKSFDLRIWLNEATTTSQAFNKVYYGKIVVTSTAATAPVHLAINLPSSPVGVYSTTFTGAVWNNKTAALEVSSISSSGRNTINLTNVSSSINLASYIIGLSGSTQGTGQVVNENGYRYEGKDPNNYISFNGELWRIIGVFDDTTHGVTGTNLVKIIRNEPIGSYVWDKSNTNDWPNSSLYHLLNDYYYNGTNESTVTYCYGSGTDVPANCDFTYNGITNSTYRSMIQNVTWHLGGTATSSQNAAAFYTAERGTTVYTGRSTTSTGNIGLMYMSDYGYSVLASSCARTTNMGSYSSSTCAGQSWMYGKGYTWTIVPYSSTSYHVWRVSYRGYASYDYAFYGYAVGPVLYLKSSVKTYAGDGSKTNPYIITV